MKSKIVVCAFASMALAAAPVLAQEDHHFAISGGGGFTQPVGNTGRNVDLGWNIRGGVGFNFEPHIGVMLNLGYDHMGVNDRVLGNLGFGGGAMSIFSATLDPIVHINPKGRVDFYLTGGGGFFHRMQDFTQPGVATGTGYDPFFGFYQYATPANIVVASYSVNKPGVDAGAGFAFGSKWNGKFFAEAKYNRIFMGYGRHTDYIPVTFGFRW